LAYLVSDDVVLLSCIPQPRVTTPPRFGPAFPPASGQRAQHGDSMRWRPDRARCYQVRLRTCPNSRIDRGRPCRRSRRFIAAVARTSPGIDPGRHAEEAAGLRYKQPNLVGKHVFRVREIHVRDHLVPLLRKNRLGAAKLDLILRGLALNPQHTGKRSAENRAREPLPRSSSSATTVPEKRSTTPTAAPATPTSRSSAGSSPPARSPSGTRHG
jgi:hypothetical protein